MELTYGGSTKHTINHGLILVIALGNDGVCIKEHGFGLVYKQVLTLLTQDELQRLMQLWKPSLTTHTGNIAGNVMLSHTLKAAAAASVESASATAAPLVQLAAAPSAAPLVKLAAAPAAEANHFQQK